MTLEPDIFDRVRLAREGAAVERCHTHPHPMRYSVGHHTCDLCTLIVLTWQAHHLGDPPSAALLVAALFHDIPEQVTGDVPQPIKHLLGEAVETVDSRVLDWLGVEQTGLTDEEAEWLRVADRVELYLWCCEQMHQNGSYVFRSWLTDYDDYFVANPPPLVFKRLMYDARGGMHRLLFSQLKEVGGL